MPASSSSFTCRDTPRLGLPEHVGEVGHGELGVAQQVHDAQTGLLAEGPQHVEHPFERHRVGVQQRRGEHVFRRGHRITI